MSSWNFKVTEHTIPAQHIRQYPHATFGKDEDVLHLAVKQYTPLDNLNPQYGDVTIIGAHANGFPKELYEPLWDGLLIMSKSSGFRIRNIWIADVAHQGLSSVINEDKLGNDPSWFDHPRDLLYMINIFRDSMPRPLIGVGHSMGGAHLVQLSLIHPRLFETLVLMDPVIQSFTNPQSNGVPAAASSHRRDRWPSRKTAEESFKKSKFYQPWDSRVLDLWIKYGLRDLPTKVHPPNAPAHPYEQQETEVTLTTTKHQEVFTFMRPTMSQTPPSGFSKEEWDQLRQYHHPDMDTGEWENTFGFYRPEPRTIFNNLQYLRPSVLYIFGEESFLSSERARIEKMKVTGMALGGSGGEKAGMVKGFMMYGTGHLIPMEKVEATAQKSAEWISSELQRWKANEKLIDKHWSKVPDVERYTLSEETMNKFKSVLKEASKPKDTKL